MRTALLLLPLMLAACERAVQIDCSRNDLKAFHGCFERNRDNGEAKAVVACLPFSERISTTGFWVVGFEKGDFFEGSRLPPREILWTRSTGADLILDKMPIEVTERPKAFEVAIIGRRALCPMSAINPYPIAVEKLQIKRRVI